MCKRGKCGGVDDRALTESLTREMFRDSMRVEVSRGSPRASAGPSPFHEHMRLSVSLRLLVACSTSSYLLYSTILCS